MKTKKLLSLFLAMTLLPMPVYASDTKPVAQQSVSSASGELTVDIALNYPIEKSDALNMSATLTKENESITLPMTKAISNTSKSLNGKEVTAVSTANYEVSDTMLQNFHLSFANLAKGEYEFKLEGNGYRAITKTVVIDEYSVHLGVDDTSIFMMGDVNQDGAVNDTDYDVVFAAIDSQKDSDIARYDINRDGKIDVVDLSYIHQTLGNLRIDAVESKGNVIVDANAVQLDTAADVEITSGTKDDLFLDAAPVVIGFKDTTKVISTSDPIQVNLALDTVKTMQKISIDSNGINAATSGKVKVTTSDNQVIEKEFTAPVQRARSAIGNSIVVDLGNQVAVKEIVIEITGTKSNSNLAEIAKVEFINDVYDKIPVAQPAYPKNVAAKPSSESFTLSWDPVTSVDNYEVKYEYVDIKTHKNTVKTIKTDKNTILVEGLDNYVEYVVSVQSTTDDGWSSGYGSSVSVMPKPSSVPKLVTDVAAKGSYRAIQVSWGKAKDSTSYTVYYRKKGESSFKSIKDILLTSYKLENLDDNGDYEIYVTASNEIGEGPKSATVAASTINMVATITPKYKLVNATKGFNEPTAHIANVTYPSLNVNDYPYTYDKFDIVDDDFTSYWNLNSWDAGGLNAGKPSPIVEFDQEYEFGEFVVVPSYNAIGGLAYVKVQYWDAEGNLHKDVNATMKSYQDANKNVYYRVMLDQPIQAKKVQVNVAQYWAGNNNIKISELKFYKFDTLKNDINALFKDQLQIELNENVTADTIAQLRTRLETKDQDDLHPDYASLKKDLDYANDILNDKDLSNEITTVDQNLSTKNDSYMNYSYQISDLQPLGLAANEGDELTFYLGKDASAQGSVQVVFSQVFAAPSSWATTVTLKPGKNVITVPKITSKDIEHGGSIYLRYVGTKPNYGANNPKIKVRVSGGTRIPSLNVTGMSEVDAKAAMSAYIDALDTYVNTTLPEIYKDNSTNEQTQSYNVTEIMSDQMLYSIPAKEAWKGITAGAPTKEERIEKLYQNTLASEQLMTLTYSQKGISRDAEDVYDRASTTRMNIRYMDVQTAFMYAGGGHVGIPYGSSSALLNGKPYVKNGDKYSGGSLYGWGIAHEIGHELDNSKGVYGETTNNIVSLFAQTIDETTFSRIGNYEDDYSKIYSKVTSGAEGLSTNVFTQLGMFWQLHLAYDDNYIDPLDTDVFNAKLNKLYRRTNAAGVDKDNLLIRLASDAAQKDLTDYFAHWGLKASNDTIAYLQEKGYPKEDKPLYYLNETARRNRIENTATMDADTKLNVTLDHEASNGNDSRRAVLHMSVDKSEDKILGYEISRNGKVIAFTNDPEYIDTVSTSNNRVFTYSVVAYDYALNKTAEVTLDPIKIKHDGSVDKTNWTLNSNATEDQLTEGMNITNTPVDVNIDKIHDGNYDNAYVGSVTKGNVEIIIDMNNSQGIAGFKYTAAKDENGNMLQSTVKNYDVQISADGKTWKSVAAGTFALNADTSQEIVYFAEDGDQASKKLEIHDAKFVKFIAKQTTASMAEFDIIAPPGDNVELNVDETGILKDNYEYAPGKVIPKGSFVMNGIYSGNPAFNVILIKDDKGDNVLGKDNKLHGILLANLPENGTLGDIATGRWIYWIEPDQFDEAQLPKKMKAELYRVDDATTLEGQRLVSDTLYINLPDALNEIELQSNAGNE